MGLFYKTTRKQISQARRQLFLNRGIPALKNNGFEETPFDGQWFGHVNSGIYIYQMCRLNPTDHLEIVTTYISGGDRWIKINLNIFSLKPMPKSLSELKGKSMVQFYKLPNALTNMRLRIDDYFFIPLFRMLGKQHKIKSFYTERGFNRRVKRLGDLIENDLTNIDGFVARWYELNKPLITDWEGNQVR